MCFVCSIIRLMILTLLLPLYYSTNVCCTMCFRVNSRVEDILARAKASKAASASTTAMGSAANNGSASASGIAVQGNTDSEVEMSQVSASGVLNKPAAPTSARPSTLSTADGGVPNKPAAPTSARPSTLSTADGGVPNKPAAPTSARPSTLSTADAGGTKSINSSAKASAVDEKRIGVDDIASTSARTKRVTLAPVNAPADSRSRNTDSASSLGGVARGRYANTMRDSADFPDDEAK